MKNHVERIKEFINRKKKKIIIGTSIFIIGTLGLGVLGATFIYNRAKSNTNYTIEEAEVIALKAVQGEVIKVTKNLEIENLGYEYEFKIKDSNNILREVTVDATLGVITELEDYYD